MLCHSTEIITSSRRNLSLSTTLYYLSIWHTSDMWTHQPVLVLEDLHWLPVSQRVVFKMALMVWKCVHGVASAYLSDLCIPATAISGCQHHLRSAATGTPLVPRTQTATGQRSFAVNGPATWNRLPPALWSLDLSESTFRQALKTHLFSTARRHRDIFMILAPDMNIQTYLLTYFIIHV